jgi:drug/metabolite transporter (DMT)-like permease
MKSSATSAGLAAVMMWGLAPVATRAVIFDFGPLPLLVLRALIAGTVLLPWALPVLRRLDRRSFSRMALVGLLGMVGYYLPVAVGIQWVPASTAALILATEPVWILCLGRLCYGERVARWAWAGSALAVGGVAIIAGLSAGHGASGVAGGRELAGIGLVLLGTVLFAAYTIALRPFSSQYGAVPATAASTVLGALPYLAFCQVLADPGGPGGRPAGAWGELVFLALGSSVAGMLLWNVAVQRMGSARAGLLLFLEPCVGVTGGAALLGEHLPAAAIGGGLLVMAGVVIAWTAQRRQRDEPAAGHHGELTARAVAEVPA